MPAPTTAEELLDLLQKSNLVDEARLRTYVQKLRDTSSLPSDPNKFAGVLVRDALLTYFQAEQLLQGKYKRFTLGKYKVLEKLGSGGMGTVFLCEHKLMRRRVAVKVLPVPKAEDKASLDRFYREAKAAAAVDHPNIVRAYDIDQDENLHFLVMEWVDGTNLQELVKKFGPLDVLRACHYVYGAAVGLQHAYEIGLLHRDIKPGNILIDRSGVVKILDLGLARLTHDTDDQLTRQNDENVLGTADYLAPEQALDSHTVDTRADIYSLGATFYFLLTGSAPFPEGSVAQKLIWHQSRQPKSLKLLRPEVPDEIVAVVEKMMAKDQTKRYQTPSDVMTALSGWMSTPIPPPSEREMPTLSPAVAGERSNRPSASPSMVGMPSGGLLRPFPSGPPTLSGMPTTINTRAETIPLATESPADAGVWSTLDGETQGGGRGDTDKPEPADRSEPDEERPSRVRRRGPTARDGRRSKLPLILLTTGAAAVLVSAAIGVYLTYFNKKEDDGPGPIGPGPPASRKITVSKAGGENVIPTLREALLRARPGDTIVIADAKISEPPLKLDLHNHKGVTIESAAADKPAIIEYTYGGKGGVMLDVPSVEGLRVRNVEFDGKGNAEIGVQVSGISPGATFENVTVRNVTKHGFNVWNVTADAARPVTLDRVRALLMPSTESGVSVLATGGLDNKFVTVKNGRFEGPGSAGIRVDGPAVDLEMTNNRFYNLNAAVSFARPGGRVRFTNNTVYRAQVGLLFDVPGPPPPPKEPPKAPLPPPPTVGYDLKVSLNYFAHVPELVRCPVAIEGWTVTDNFHDAGSQPGNPPLPGAAKLDAPTLPPPNPNDDANFLRFPADKFPTAGPNKARVGANPP